jgi:hypothetical protein
MRPFLASLRKLRKLPAAGFRPSRCWLARGRRWMHRKRMFHVQRFAGA